MKMAGTYASLPNRARRSRSVGKASGTLLATSRSSLVLVARQSRVGTSHDTSEVDGVSSDQVLLDDAAFVNR
jgi:hypothetical protein